MQRSNSIKETRELQEDYVQKAQDQLDSFQQAAKLASNTASQSELTATQLTQPGLVLPPKQIPEKAPAPNTRHLRQIVRTGSKSASQVTKAPACFVISDDNAQGGQLVLGVS